MSEALPEGFIPVPIGRTPTVSFETKRDRFFVSKSLRDEYGIKAGQRVGLAYNPTNKQLLIDTGGYAFKVNSGYYINSKYFAERVYPDSFGEDKVIRFKMNSDMTNGQFLVFDEV